MESILQQKYLITRWTNTSYVDVDELTSIERQSIIKLLTEEKQQEQERLKKLKSSQS